MSTIKTILILGGESTGKSTLAQRLAQHFNTVYVPEYARTYLDALDRPYEQFDLSLIGIGQMALEDSLLPEAHEFLFCDTGIDVITLWSAHRYGSVDEALLEWRSASHYDAILVTAPDLPWESDPLREHPNDEDRAFFFSHYKQVAEKSGRPFCIVEGQGKARFNTALEFLLRTFPNIDSN
ncbi:MAG: ATP-binding protein [Chitinophagaceae bacterium]|nr:ATP-binding protein [Chitinophagaceae bacterium]